MALGQRNNGSDDTKLLILKPVNKNDKGEKVDPHFQVSEKIDGKWTVTREETRVSGDLYKVEVKEQEWKENKYKTISIGLKDRDAKESYLLDLRFNMTSRNLFNMLSTLTSSFSGLSISYYLGKNGYERFSLRQGDTLVPWKYGIADLPKPEEVTFKGKVQRDYSAIDNLFEKELNELAKRLGSAPKTKAVTPTTTSAAVSKPGTPAGADEDVPF